MKKQVMVISAFLLGVLACAIYCVGLGAIQNNPTTLFLGVFLIFVTIIAVIWTRGAIKKRHLMLRHSIRKPKGNSHKN